MPAVHLRRVPPELWEPFKARAEAAGLSHSWILLSLIASYARGEVHVDVPPIYGQTEAAGNRPATQPADEK